MTHTIAVINGKTQNDTDFYNFLNALADGNSFVAGLNDYKVIQSGTPGMSVQVTLGKAFLYIGSKSSYFQSYLDTTTTLSITSNSSGSTRIDIICVKFDTSVTSDSVGGNIVTLQVVAGTPGAGVPATPANYYKLAEVSVANNATSIVNANITDKRQNLVLQSGVVQFVGLVNGTPSNPVSGVNKLYFKTDNNLYMLNSSGTETQVNAIKRSISGVSLGSSFTTTSLTPVDTGLTLTITTTVSSNIRISLLGSAQNNTAGRQIQLFILRAGAQIRATAFVPVSTSQRATADFAYLDLAVTAGTYTYKIQMCTDGTNTDTILLLSGAQLIVEVDAV